MGVYIKGMEMPKEGSWTTVRVYPDGTIGRPIGFGDYALVEGAKAIPAADVRPARRGRWIPVGTDDMDRGMFRCSECGSEHFFPELLLKIPADNFCSDCGADMREES